MNAYLKFSEDGTTVQLLLANGEIVGTYLSKDVARAEIRLLWKLKHITKREKWSLLREIREAKQLPREIEIIYLDELDFLARFGLSSLN